MTEYITYCDAVIPEIAAQMIYEMQLDPVYAGEIMEALSYAIDFLITSDDSDLDDTVTRTNLVNLVLVTRLMKLLVVSFKKPEYHP